MVCLLAFQKNGLNDQKEASDLTEAVKQLIVNVTGSGSDLFMF